MSCKSCKGNCSPPPTIPPTDTRPFSFWAMVEWLLGTVPPATVTSCQHSVMQHARSLWSAGVDSPACVPPPQPLAKVYSLRGSKSVKQRWSSCCTSTAEQPASTSVPPQHCFGHKPETQYNRDLKKMKKINSILVILSILIPVFTC